ncbi:hypothetical protein Tco_0611565 [Tanacetum coccineum]
MWIMYFKLMTVMLFDSDVDEAPTAHTMFMANLSSADPVYDKVGPSYDSDILSKVQDHVHYQDAVCEHHEKHEMHDDVQPNYIVDSHVNYTSDSNMIMYDQYVKDNAVPVVQSNVSSVPNDAYMMILNDMHEPHAQSVSDTTRKHLIKMKEEALKEQTTASRPIKVLTVFTEMHDAHTIVEARCLELEAELSNLRDKIQKDNHNELVKLFSNLEVNHLNLQLKYQNLKERFRNNPPPPTRETPDFDSVFVIRKMKASLQGKDNIKRAKHIEQTTALTTENENLKAQIQNKMKSVTKDHVKPIVLAPETLHKIVEEAKVERPFDRSLASAYLYTKHSQELILICELALVRNDFNTTQFKKLATTTLIRKKARVNCCTNARGSQPRNNTKKNRISPAKRVNNKKVEEYPRTNRSKLRTTNHVDYSSSSKRTLSKFGNLCKLGKYGNPQAKCLPVLVINGDPQAEYSL